MAKSIESSYTTALVQFSCYSVRQVRICGTASRVKRLEVRRETVAAICGTCLTPNANCYIATFRVVRTVLIGTGVRPESFDPVWAREAVHVVTGV